MQTLALSTEMTPMNEPAPAGAETSLLSLPPTHRQTRWAIAVAVCQVAAFALVAPFARTRLAEINAFIPAFEGVIFVTDLVTSVLLFSQFAIYRLRALLVLACGYLFSALMIIPHALTFPGAFSPTGLLGAGLQTTASLYWFWHLLFPMTLLGYGLLRDEKSDAGPAEPSLLAVVVGSVALVLALACGLTLLATAGNNYLPVLFADRVGFTPAARVAAATTMLLSASAGAVLWLRQRSLLDQWLIIVALAVLLEMALGSMFVSGRFSLGFYAGRLFSLLTSTIVLVVLLVETMRFHANVARSREMKIRRLVDANILGICISNLEGAIIEANEAFLRMLQYSREDVVSRRLRWTDLTPAEWREQNERSVAELRSTGAFHPVEKEYFRKDGSRVPVLVGGALFERSGNEGVAFVLDLTERKRAEQAMRESEERFRDYAEIASDWFWEIGPDYRFTLLTENAFGADTASRIGTTCWDHALDLETEPEKWRLVQETLDSRKPFRDFVYLTAGGDGSPIYVRASGRPAFNPSGEFRGYRGTGSDVTDIVRTEEALRKSEQNLRSAIDGIPGLVGVLTPAGEVDNVNRQILDYCGRSLEDLKDWGSNGIIHSEDLAYVVDVFTKSIAAGIPYRIEHRLRRFDGEYRWFDNRGVPVRDDAGRIVRWYVLLTDIEDRTQALTRLQQMQSDLAHINRMSTMGELAASLSHEILHPVATARNNARAGMRFLEMNPPNLDEAREALGCIVRDTDRAKDIVGRIRSQIKRAPPRKMRFGLNEAVNEVIAMVQGAITRSGVSVSTRLVDGLVPVQGDRVQLQQVLVNLILNAVEAMSSIEDGTRELSIRTGQSQTGDILVAVQDSGPGVDPVNLERVFEPFYTTKTSGIGMGLSICRTIINDHGGRLWMSPNEPRGAVFQFTLPAVQENS
jgi:PAS domain S-box-containing protein